MKYFSFSRITHGIVMLGFLVPIAAQSQETWKQRALGHAKQMVQYAQKIPKRTFTGIADTLQLGKQATIKRLRREYALVKTGTKAAFKKLKGKSLTKDEQKNLHSLELRTGALIGLMILATTAIGSTIWLRRRHQETEPLSEEKEEKVIKTGTSEEEIKSPPLLPPPPPPPPVITKSKFTILTKKSGGEKQSLTKTPYPTSEEKEERVKKIDAHQKKSSTIPTQKELEKKIKLLKKPKEQKKEKKEIPESIGKKNELKSTQTQSPPKTKSQKFTESPKIDYMLKQVKEKKEKKEKEEEEEEENPAWLVISTGSKQQQYFEQIDLNVKEARKNISNANQALTKAEFFKNNPVRRNEAIERAKEETQAAIKIITELNNNNISTQETQKIMKNAQQIEKDAQNLEKATTEAPLEKETEKKVTPKISLEEEQKKKKEAETKLLEKMQAIRGALQYSEKYSEK